ncbi:MAG: DNA internalization-related competence protein ComEC/Rec2 [Lachnospiraceae bacterium]|nr:DNA internalization-related competence protein ComEC/Rec2 [Lachnospiraceae bacterium]
MTKRKLASLLVSFLLGICGVLFDFSLFLLIFLGYLMWQFSVLVSGKIKGKRRWVYLAVLLAAFFAGGAKAGCREEESRGAQSFFISGEEVSLFGRLSKKEEKGEQFYYYLKDNILKSKKGTYSCPKILVILSADEYSMGEILRITGKIKTFHQPENEGGFHELAYYQSLHIDGAVEKARVEKSFGGSFPFQEKLYQIRKKFRESYVKCMKDSHGRLMAAMTLGEKSGMDQELKALFQKAGVSHFYSISGIHLSILGMGLYRALKKKCNGYAAAAFGGTFVLCYSCLTGFGISQTRAAGMFFLLLYGKCRGKSYDMLTSLSLMASLMAWENPMIFYHTGFLLSFGAVAGVLVAGELKKACFRKELSGLRDTVLVSVCIQLTTIPILCNAFYEVSLYSVFVNLVILPCMGILLGLGMAGMLAGCFSVAVGKILLYPCTLILLVFEAVCRISTALPLAVFITGKPPVFKVLLWYGSILVFFICRKKKKFLIPGTAVCILAFTIFFLCPLPREREWDVLDVGQGDGICFMEEDGTVMFLDGGSTTVSKVGTYRILPFLKYHGIRQVDYWFLSHLDKDHTSGMMEVAKSGFPIKYLVLAEGIVRDEAWEELNKFAAKQDIPILYMKQRGTLAGADRRWEITCLFPEDTNEETDRNDASMVLFYKSSGFSGLFTGDLSLEQEEKLAEKYKFPEIDVLKISHHGSKYGTCEKLLAGVSPKTAVISCGKNNRYGHPGEETLMRLHQWKAEVYDTRFTGQIKFREGRITTAFSVND